MSRLVRSLIDEWLSPLTDKCLKLTREEIERRLCADPTPFYVPEAVWIKEGTINPTLKQIQLVCVVPEPHYTNPNAPIGHVAEEQQVRCYNQAAYLLGGLLKELGDASFDLPTVDSHCFLLVEKNWRHRRAEPTGHPWNFTLQVTKAYKRAGVAYYQFRIVKGSIEGTIGAFYNPEGSQQTADKKLYNQLYHRWQRVWETLPALKLDMVRLVARLRTRFRPEALPVPSAA